MKVAGKVNVLLLMGTVKYYANWKKQRTLKYKYGHQLKLSLQVYEQKAEGFSQMLTGKPTKQKSQSRRMKTAEKKRGSPTLRSACQRYLKRLHLSFLVNESRNYEGGGHLVRSFMYWMVPGGRVCSVRVLLTAMVILHGIVGSFLIKLPISASKGRWPPSCSVTLTPFSHCQNQR